MLVDRLEKEEIKITIDNKTQLEMIEVVNLATERARKKIEKTKKQFHESEIMGRNLKFLR